MQKIKQTSLQHIMIHGGNRMKKIMRICTTLLLTLTILVPNFFVKASNIDPNLIPNEIIEQINIALLSVVDDKEHFGMSDVDFSTLAVSSPIPMYEYVNKTFCYIGEWYPLVSNNHIVAIATSPTGNGFCISSSILSKTLDSINENNIAILYDMDEAYAYNGKNLIPLFNISPEDIDVDERYIPYRDNIESNSDIDFSNVQLSSASDLTMLGFSDSGLARSTLNTYSCNVSYVTQYPYSNLCWAATLACIKNYLSGTTLTAGAVSSQCFNSPSVIDVGMPGSNVAFFMQNNYSMSYTYQNAVPSDSAMISNLSAGYPIYGGFVWYSNTNPPVAHGHACTIYSISYISPSVKSINVMDPSYGAGISTATFNGTNYVFTSAYGHDMFLQEGICHTW